jgi:hypothetical protein
MASANVLGLVSATVLGVGLVLEWVVVSATVLGVASAL